jgi:type II secretory pathway component PulF
MKCPNCQFDQPENDFCMACGIEIASWANEDILEQRREDKIRKAALTVDGTLDSKTATLEYGEKLNIYAGLARISKSRRVKMTLLEALLKLSADAPAPIKKVLSALAQRLNAGSTLSAAMSSFPKLFDNVEIQIVKAYERLECPIRAFPAMADRTWRQVKFREWIKRSLFYPSVVLLLAAFFIPIKQLRLGMGSYVAGVLMVLVAILVIGFLLSKVLPHALKHPRVVTLLRRVAWFLPYPANLYRMWIRSVFCKALADNLDAGISKSRALHGAALVTQDPQIIKSASHVISHAGAKREMASKLWSEGLIEGKDAMFLISGEYSSEFTESLRELAHEYETESVKKSHAFLFFVSSSASVFMLVFFGLAAIDSVKEMTQGVKEAFSAPNQFR